MEILIKAAQLILSLSILVIFHEAGHFTFAKLFKTRVEKFYLFFDPWFSLFKYKKGETEYGVGWLPLGGYVKISGMIDESMDKEQLSKPPEPWEFRSKPAYQRLLIMVGGVLVNILLAMMIYVMVLFIWGEQYLPTKNATYGIMCDSTALEAGFQYGDKILSIDNEEVKDFGSIVEKILLDEPTSLQVGRNGRVINIPITNELIARIIREESTFIEPAFPFIIGEFTSGSLAKEAGLIEGDQIIALNDKSMPFFGQYPPVLYEYKEQKVDLTIVRGNDTIQKPVLVSENGKIGVSVATAKMFDFEKKKYGFFEAIPAGISKGYNTVGSYLKQLKLIFKPETEAYKSLGGFMTIGSIFPGSWNWYAFWNMTAFLSIILGVLNLLPIPALDGGHVTFLLYEIVTGRKPSDKFLEYAQITGMILLLALLVYANGNDVIKYFFTD